MESEQGLRLEYERSGVQALVLSCDTQPGKGEAEGEAKALSEIVGCQALSGEAATREAVMKKLVHKPHSLVYVSGHTAPVGKSGQE